MTNKTSALLTLLASIFLAVGASQFALAQNPKEVVDAVNEINDAFMRGNMTALMPYMHEEVTMLHGGARLNNRREVEAQWTKLFAARARANMTHTLRTRELKTQTYGNVFVVTFAYEHPHLSGARVTTESGKAVYVLIRETIAGKKPIVMVHCSIVADRVGEPPLP